MEIFSFAIRFFVVSFFFKFSFIFSAYNIATGNVSTAAEPVPADDKSVRHRKRRREREPPAVQIDEIGESKGPMSHQDYINKRR